MKLTVLGAGTCIPYPGFSPAGYLVEIGELPVLLDAGPGTLVRLAEQGVSYRDLELVLVSHLHPDHVLDLLTLLQASNATPGWQRVKPLAFYGCQGFASFLQKLFGIFDGVAPETFPLQVHELASERVDFGAWSLRTALTGHTDESLAFRLEEDSHALVYSGDVARLESLVGLAQGADLLLVECSLPDGWQTPDHLVPAQIGELALGASVRSVLLTHRYPPAIISDVVSQVKAVYSGPVFAAIDGWTATI
jgi:ribonuclease BN (tRNA processing enzyme)